MDKLARYNQKLLAAIGTLALVAVAVILIITLIVWIISLSSNYSSVDNTLQVPDSLGQDDGKIKQLVSFQEPELVDTLNNIYIIPVTQRTLEKPMNKKDYRIVKEAYSSSNDFYYSDWGIGSYNNLIVYRKNEARKRALFDFRINITRYHHRIILDKFYLFIVGTKGDTNKDGAYTNDDLDNLYIYDFENEYLKTISLEHAGFEGSNNLYETEEMILSFGMDINNNGEFDELREPIRLKHYSIPMDELTDFIPGDLQDQLQEIID